MHTTPQARIDELTARGDWGNDTLVDNKLIHLLGIILRG